MCRQLKGGGMEITMKITFVGSSHGVPEPNRKCSCIMIEIGEQIYFVDMGTSAIDALQTKGLAVDAVKGIFITHMHGDHTNGLIQFVDLLTWKFKTADPIIFLPVMDAVKVINDWVQLACGRTRDLRYCETVPSVVFDDGILKVTAIPTMHCYKSYAYLVEAEGKSVLFTGDLKGPEADFPAIATEKVLDLVICESAHFQATEYFPIFEKCNIKKVCVTHYSNKRLASVLQLQEELATIDLPMVMATDNLELNL